MAADSGQTLAAGAFIEAQGEAALPVRFSDGSQITLSPHARARLVELDADGAHLLLEGGHAQVAVVPRAHTRFRISAGPFVVRVKGTRFGVAWDAERDRFELRSAARKRRGCRLRAGPGLRDAERAEGDGELQGKAVRRGAGGEGNGDDGGEEHRPGSGIGDRIGVGQGQGHGQGHG